MATRFGWSWLIGKRGEKRGKDASAPEASLSAPPSSRSANIEALEPRTFLSATASAAVAAAPPTGPTISFTQTQRLESVSSFKGYIATGVFTSTGLEDFASTRGNDVSNAIYIYLNNGNDTFTQSQVYHLNDPRGIVAGDFNNDGITDLAVVAENDTNGTDFTSNNTGTRAAIFILYGNGDGTFQAPVRVSHTRMGFGAMTAADFTNNGQLDLAVTNGQAVSIYLNNGNGTFSGPTRYSTGIGNAAYITAADLNGDGIPDLVVGKGINPYVSILMGQTINGQPTGVFDPFVRYHTHNLPVSVSVADLTGAGGLPDIVVGNNGFRQGVSVLMNNGDGTFAPQVTYPAGNFVRYVTTGDFANDGTVDIASTDFGGPMNVFANNGDGAFDSPQTFELGRYGDFLTPIDLGNGVDSLLVSHGGDVSVLLNTTPAA